MMHGPSHAVETPRPGLSDPRHSTQLALLRVHNLLQLRNGILCSTNICAASVRSLSQRETNVLLELRHDFFHELAGGLLRALRQRQHVGGHADGDVGEQHLAADVPVDDVLLAAVRAGAYLRLRLWMILDEREGETYRCRKLRLGRTRAFP